MYAPSKSIQSQLVDLEDKNRIESADDNATEYPALTKMGHAPLRGRILYPSRVGAIWARIPLARDGSRISPYTVSSNPPRAFQI